MMARISVSAFKRHIEPFLESRSMVSRVSAETVKANTLDLGDFIRFVSEKNIKYISGRTLYGYFSHLTAMRHLKAVSANRKLETLKTYNKYLCLMAVKGAKDLPIREMPRIRDGYGHFVRTLEFCEIKNMFEHLQNIKGRGNRSQDLTVARDYVLFMLQYLMGLRSGEVHRIDLHHIDWRNKTILIKGKGNLERILPLVGKLPVFLKNYCVDIRARYLNAGTASVLFLSKKGRRLSVRTMEDNFKKYFKDFYPRSCRRLVPHTLRHAFATHFIASHPDDIITLKAVLGHKHTRSTEIYLHPTTEMLRKSIENHPAVQTLNKVLMQRGVRAFFEEEKARAG